MRAREALIAISEFIRDCWTLPDDARSRQYRQIAGIGTGDDLLSKLKAFASSTGNIEAEVSLNNLELHLHNMMGTRMDSDQFHAHQALAQGQIAAARRNFKMQ